MRKSTYLVVSVLGFSAIACGARLDEESVRTSQAGAQKLVALAVGDRNACALDETGSVACLEGESTIPAIVPGLTEVTSIAAGSDHTCALDAAGTVLCWGENTHGEIDGSRTPKTTPVARLTGATAVAAAFGHSCAIVDGGVRCWGSKAWDPHGYASADVAKEPVVVEGISGAASITIGPFHGCAITQDRKVACWGSNYAGQLGDGGTAASESARVVEGLDRVVGIALGAQHTCALRDDGEVLCWGADFLGQLGPAGEGGQSVLRPSKAVGIAGAKTITAGADHTCVGYGDRGPECWGWGDGGQVTGARAGVVRAPAQPTALPAGPSIAAGGSRTCAIEGERAIVCIGSLSRDD
jgi:alpha-tubulin suppressor-like RCC1 family protein